MMQFQRKVTSYWKSKNSSDCFSKAYWKSAPKQWFPILSWLHNYTLEDFKGDFIGGFSVGLTVVPQALALAQMAGLPLQYGLYSAFMGSFMYAIFGTCKDLVIGPTSVMALMTAQYIQMGGPAYATILTFLCGCFQLVFGVLNLGFLINYISTSVLNGFTTAAAIIISTSQLKGLLGLKFQSRGFLDNVYKLFENIPHANFYDMGMGITTMIILLLLKSYKDAKCSCLHSSPKLQDALKTFWWSFVTARNAILVVLCSFAASIFLSMGFTKFTLTQHVDAGLPSFAFPPFTIPLPDSPANGTLYKSTLDILKDLGAGVIIIPFLSLLEAIAIAKVFSRSKKLDATREMVAVGMGNLMGSFVSSYPVTGSFSRTVINNASGVRTPLGGIFSGCLVLLALGVIAPSFHYIPKASLSAILFTAVIFMIHYQDIPAMWNTNKLELIPYFVTFICSITLGLEFGLLFGVVISLAMLLYKQNKPHINIRHIKVDNKVTHIHVTPDDCIYFPSIEYFKGKITEALLDCKGDSECKVIIHGDRLTGMDYSTALGIKSMVNSLKNDGISVEFQMMEPAAVKALRCLRNTVPFCNSHEELEDNTPNAVDENAIKLHVDVHDEQSSVEPLLMKSTS